MTRTHSENIQEPIKCRFLRTKDTQHPENSNGFRSSVPGTRVKDQIPLEIFLAFWTFFFSFICFLIKSKTVHCNTKLSQRGKKKKALTVSIWEYFLEEHSRQCLDLHQFVLTLPHSAFKVSWLGYCLEAQSFTRNVWLLAKSRLSLSKPNLGFPPAEEEM